MVAITPAAARCTTVRCILSRIAFGAAVLCAWAFAFAPHAARAGIDNDLTLERYVVDGLPARASLAEPADRGKRQGLPFAILPQVGYGPETGGKAGADISAPAAWDVTTGDPSVIVAVIDTGVDATQPDLAGVVRPQIDLVVKYHDAGRLEFVEIRGLRHRSSGFVHVCTR